MTNKGLQIEGALIPCNLLPGMEEIEPRFVSQSDLASRAVDHDNNASTAESKIGLGQNDASIVKGSQRQGKLRRPDHNHYSYRPFRTPGSVSRSGFDPANTGICLLSLNCVVRSTRLPVMLIIAD